MNCFFSERVPAGNASRHKHWRSNPCWLAKPFRSHQPATIFSKCKCICLQEEAVAHIKLIKERKQQNDQNMVFWKKTWILILKEDMHSTSSSVILRKGEPPPIEAYPSLLLGARSTQINFPKGLWRNRNSQGVL